MPKSRKNREKKSDIREHSKRKAHIGSRKIAEYGKKKQLGLVLNEFKRLSSRPNIKLTVHVYTSVINACVRCGEVERAMEFMKQMELAGISPNHVTCTALIKGLVQDNQISLALKLLKIMNKRKILPNERTFDTILRGCVRWGDLKTANQIFEDMKQYKITPTVSTFEYWLKTACENLEIDLAWKIIALMEEKNVLSHSGILAVAKASALYGDFEQAQKALSIYDVLEKPSKSSFSENKSNNKKMNASTQLFQQTNDKEMKLEYERIDNYLLKIRLGHHQKNKEKKNQEKKMFSLVNGAENVIFISKDTPKKNLDFKSIFHNNKKPIKLEICSGMGDWVVQRAQEDNIDSNWIGVEIRYERVYHIWSKMIFEQVKNLLVLGGEAHYILEHSISNSSLDEVYINFPDPPVWEESKQRLIDQNLLQLLHSRILPKGYLIIATDDELYARSIVSELEHHKGFISCFETAFLNKLPDDYGSSYFDRLWKQGKKKNKRFYLKYQRVDIGS